EKAADQAKAALCGLVLAKERAVRELRRRVGEERSNEAEVRRLEVRIGETLQDEVAEKVAQLLKRRDALEGEIRAIADKAAKLAEQQEPVVKLKQAKEDLVEEIRSLRDEEGSLVGQVAFKERSLERLHKISEILHRKKVLDCDATADDAQVERQCALAEAVYPGTLPTSMVRRAAQQIAQGLETEGLGLKSKWRDDLARPIEAVRDTLERAMEQYYGVKELETTAQRLRTTRLAPSKHALK
ncbi:unnamed protein product, partial [Durusdinium trenchii]